MEKNIPSLNWRIILDDNKIDMIDNEIILFEKPVITATFQYPFKVDVTTAIICLKGTTEGAINLRPFKTTAPCLILVLPGQILEHKYLSEDFSGLFIVMSKRFTDNLMPNAQERLPLMLSVRDNPVIPINNEEALAGMVDYFNMLRRVIRVKDHPNRSEVVRYITLAFFYGIGGYLHHPIEPEKESHQEVLVEKFLNMVQTNYKRQRSLEFYADKLCLTPKHLSKVIKDTTGKSANDIIDEHVVLEAKALLKSTNMTVQQIGDELNFSCQSFFGKYFKRIVGVSPKEYKVK
jgi:AraC-like DNA-binding protein